MIIKPIYICEKCGKEHKSEKAALECEKCHKTVSTICDYDYDCGSPYPELIHVSLTGAGPRFIYKLYREEPYIMDDKMTKAMIKDKWDR